MAFVFFVLTIIQTQRRDVRPWKANPLVMLLASVDEELQQRSIAAGQLERHRGLEKAIAKEKVSLHWPPAGVLVFTTGVHSDVVASKRGSIYTSERHD